MIAACRRAPLVALDTETSALDPMRARLVGLSLAVARRPILVPAVRARGAGRATRGRHRPAAICRRSRASALRPLRELLADPAVRKAGHHIKYDWLVLRRSGVELAGVDYDSMLAAFVLDPGRRSFALDELARDRLNVRLRTYGELAGRGRSEREFAAVPLADAARYCCDDSETVLRLREALAVELDEHRLQPLARSVEMPLVPVLVDMEWAGVPVDRARLAELSRGFAVELASLERLLYAAAGAEFNLNSTPQLRSILFNKLQLPILKKTKTGPSTDVDVLEQLAAMGHEVPKLLIEYRELAKLKSTYVDALPGYIHPDTGRIHTSFNQVGAATGRLSSASRTCRTSPCAPSGGIDPPRVRRAPGMPAAGGRLLPDRAAPAGPLLRGSGVRRGVRAGRRHPSPDRGGDLRRAPGAGHRRKCARGPRRSTSPRSTDRARSPWRGSSASRRTKRRRSSGSTSSGSPGCGRGSIAPSLEAREQGYVETIFGRRRYIPELRDRNFNIRAFGERTATNSPLQGSAADLIKVAMIRIHGSLRTERLATRLLLQVHDELVLEVPEGEEAAAKELVKRHMEGAAKLRVPLVVSVGTGMNWVDAKG